MTVNPSFTPYPESGNPKTYVVQWGPMGNGDVGRPIQDLFAYADRSVQVEGTFGSGGSMSIEGSNDGTNFHTLSNPSGSALTATSAMLAAIVEMPLQIRPRVTAGDGTTALTATMLLRRTTPGM
jgi:hypothetical protein